MCPGGVKFNKELAVVCNSFFQVLHRLVFGQTLVGNLCQEIACYEKSPLPVYFYEYLHDQVNFFIASSR